MPAGSDLLEAPPALEKSMKTTPLCPFLPVYFPDSTVMKPSGRHGGNCWKSKCPLQDRGLNLPTIGVVLGIQSMLEDLIQPSSPGKANNQTHRGCYYLVNLVASAMASIGFLVDQVNVDFFCVYYLESLVLSFITSKGMIKNDQLGLLKVDLAEDCR